LKSVTRPAQRGTIAVAQIISQVHQRQGHGDVLLDGCKEWAPSGRTVDGRPCRYAWARSTMLSPLLNAHHLPSETGVSEPIQKTVFSELLLPHILYLFRSLVVVCCSPFGCHCKFINLILIFKPRTGQRSPGP
jgi:hypothetical protein